MGKLVTIVGSSGSGKTTLARVICQAQGYTPFLEDLNVRPFQASFMRELKTYALPNQVDFLLYRAEQELIVRKNDVVGVQDGGLDLDFYVFSRLFLENKYFSADEFALVQRFYGLLRSILPPPDCIIKLNIPLGVLAERRNARRRSLDITINSDLIKIEELIGEWFAKNPPPSPVLEVDFQANDESFSKSIGGILAFIRRNVR